MSNTGRYFITKGGRTFCVEPIGGNHTVWGDIDPASKKITGDYGSKYVGCVDEAESIITEENGFKNIMTLPAGTSPDSVISELLKN